MATETASPAPKEAKPNMFSKFAEASMRQGGLRGHLTEAIAGMMRESPFYRWKSMVVDGVDPSKAIKAPTLLKRGDFTTLGISSDPFENRRNMVDIHSERPLRSELNEIYPKLHEYIESQVKKLLRANEQNPKLTQEGGGLYRQWLFVQQFLNDDGVTINQNNIAGFFNTPDGYNKTMQFMEHETMLLSMARGLLPEVSPDRRKNRLQLRGEDILAHPRVDIEHEEHTKRRLMLVFGTALGGALALEPQVVAAVQTLLAARALLPAFIQTASTSQVLGAILGGASAVGLFGSLTGAAARELILRDIAAAMGGLDSDPKYAEYRDALKYRYGIDPHELIFDPATGRMRLRDGKSYSNSWQEVQKGIRKNVALRREFLVRVVGMDKGAYDAMASQGFYTLGGSRTVNQSGADYENDIMMRYQDLGGYDAVDPIGSQQRLLQAHIDQLEANANVVYSKVEQKKRAALTTKRAVPLQEKLTKINEEITDLETKSKLAKEKMRVLELVRGRPASTDGKTPETKVTEAKGLNQHTDLFKKANVNIEHIEAKRPPARPVGMRTEADIQKEINQLTAMREGKSAVLPTIAIPGITSTDAFRADYEVEQVNADMRAWLAAHPEPQRANPLYLPPIGTPVLFKIDLDTFNLNKKAEEDRLKNNARTTRQDQLLLLDGRIADCETEKIASQKYEAELKTQQDAIKGLRESITPEEQSRLKDQLGYLFDNHARVSASLGAHAGDMHGYRGVYTDVAGTDTTLLKLMENAAAGVPPVWTLAEKETHVRQVQMLQAIHHERILQSLPATIVLPPPADIAAVQNDLGGMWEVLTHKPGDEYFVSRGYAVGTPAEARLINVRTYLIAYIQEYIASENALVTMHEQVAETYDTRIKDEKKDLEKKKARIEVQKFVLANRDKTREHGFAMTTEVDLWTDHRTLDRARGDMLAEREYSASEEAAALPLGAYEILDRVFQYRDGIVSSEGKTTVSREQFFKLLTDADGLITRQEIAKALCDALERTTVGGFFGRYMTLPRPGTVAAYPSLEHILYGIERMHKGAPLVGSLAHGGVTINYPVIQRAHPMTPSQCLRIQEELLYKLSEKALATIT